MTDSRTRSRSRSPLENTAGSASIVDPDLPLRYVQVMRERDELRQERDELRKTTSALEQEKSELVRFCNELRLENSQLMSRVDRLEGFLSIMKNIHGEFGRHLEDCGSEEEDSGLAIEDCAGSDTEEPPPIPSVLLALKDTAPMQAIENSCGPPPPLKALHLLGVRPELRDVANNIRNCDKNILVICGAGISTVCGICDFRSPDTGLYSTYKKDGLPSPQALFTLDYFKENPGPFYKWAFENWPGKAKPSITHFFLKLLYDKGKLLRCYTQNIDGLERKAGFGAHAKRLIEAHGNFRYAHAVDKSKLFDGSILKRALEKDDGEFATSTQSLRKRYGGLVKPNIVFYTETMPLSFSQYKDRDESMAELLLVLGTSLSIAWTQDMVVNCKARQKILVNLGEVLNPWSQCEVSGDWDHRFNMSCDDACEELARHLGWSDELQGMRQDGVEHW